MQSPQGFQQPPGRASILKPSSNSTVPVAWITEPTTDSRCGNFVFNVNFQGQKLKIIPVSMDPKRPSPIVTEIIWAPGASPFFSGASGKLAAAMDATWVPWLEQMLTISTTSPSSQMFTLKMSKKWMALEVFGIFFYERRGHGFNWIKNFMFFFLKKG